MAAVNPATVVAANKDKRPMCKYGEKCYRKNPNHLRDYCHPKKCESEEQQSQNDQGKVIEVEKMSVLELNSKILFHICMELNSNPSLNWKMLAGHLNCDLSLVGRYEISQDPCINVLVDWNNTSLNSTAINFCKILHDMKRYDLAKLVEEELNKLRKEQSSDC